MPYPKCKVYFDGSHYIAIPHTEKRYRPRPKKKEEVIIVKDGNASVAESPCKGEQLIDEASAPQDSDALSPLETIAVTEELPQEEQPANILQPNERLMTRKELFNEFTALSVLKYGRKDAMSFSRLSLFFK